jgi:hypothetical protein
MIRTSTDLPTLSFQARKTFAFDVPDTSAVAPLTLVRPV